MSSDDAVREIVDDFLAGVNYEDPPIGHPWISHSILGWCERCEGNDTAVELKAWRSRAERERRISAIAGSAPADQREAPRFVRGVYELSSHIGLSSSTLMSWAKEGIIPSTRMPGPRGSYLFEVEAVVAAIRAIGGQV